MPYLRSKAVPYGAMEPVELRGKLRNRFYEPIVLLLALTRACMHNHAPKVLEPVYNATSRTDEQLFHEFMNSLAQICDNNRGGRSVTAVVALLNPAGVQYRFASNERRDDTELAQVENFIKDILNTLRTSTGPEKDLVKGRVLRRIIAFNRPRLRLYVKAIHIRSQECLNAPEGTNSAQTIEDLKKLRDLSSKADDKGLEEANFFSNCTELMLYVKAVSKSATYRIFRDKANAENGQASPWGELRHAAGRLLSYLQGLKILFEARKRWDRLFHDFEVTFLPSSTALSNPMSRKSVTAEDIIGRMTSDSGRMNAYKHSAQSLQHFGLDKDIQEQAQSKKFCPIVHAEVLVHQSIKNDPELENLHPSKFFNGYRYIGSSKPTCRLCHYYFVACADSIQVRQTHRNLYKSWRLPDVYPDQGEEAVKRREFILNKMLVPIREDTFRTLDDKVPERKLHDSNTDPTFSPGTSVAYWNEDLAEGIRHLGIEKPERAGHAYSRGVQGGLTKVEEDEDEEDGGVRLS